MKSKYFIGFIAIVLGIGQLEPVASWDVVVQTVGQVWPLPHNITTELDVFDVIPETFEFVYGGDPCDILDAAFSRYYELIFNPVRKPQPSKRPSRYAKMATAGTITTLQVNLTSGHCDAWPYMDMDESYTLTIDSNASAILTASRVWGILRGLETFSQVIYRDLPGNLYANATTIYDFPRFPHRGLLLDTSRHFVPMSTILQNLDAMAQSKFNTFHWHIVDDQSFPYQSREFPDMSEKGAYVPTTHIYSLNEIVAVIDYARLRGIRVVPEYDTPGHTESWGPGVPGLLTPCYVNVSGELVLDSYGPIDPSVNTTYRFLTEFFAEIAKLFPDDYLFLGGDEVSFTCWESNPNITAFMEKKGFGRDYRKLESYYFTRLVNIVDILNKKYIVWQEVFDNKVQLKNNTIINVWKDLPMVEMDRVTAAGYQAILSSCWYLSDFTMGNDWINFYPCEPTAFPGSDQQKELVIGGEACMWGEYVDATNLISRTWPRALAPAERLWSDISVNNATAATPRFEEHRCRMVTRGINAEPVNGPSSCSCDYMVS